MYFAGDKPSTTTLLVEIDPASPRSTSPNSPLRKGEHTPLLRVNVVGAAVEPHGANDIGQIEGSSTATKSPKTQDSSALPVWSTVSAYVSERHSSSSSSAAAVHTARLATVAGSSSSGGAGREGTLDMPSRISPILHHYQQQTTSFCAAAVPVAEHTHYESNGSNVKTAVAESPSSPPHHQQLSQRLFQSSQGVSLKSVSTAAAVTGNAVENKCEEVGCAGGVVAPVALSSAMQDPTSTMMLPRGSPSTLCVPTAASTNGNALGVGVVKESFSRLVPQFSTPCSSRPHTPLRPPPPPPPPQTIIQKDTPLPAMPRVTSSVSSGRGFFASLCGRFSTGSVGTTSVSSAAPSTSDLASSQLSKGVLESAQLTSLPTYTPPVSSAMAVPTDAQSNLRNSEEAAPLDKPSFTPAPAVRPIFSTGKSTDTLPTGSMTTPPPSLPLEPITSQGNDSAQAVIPCSAPLCQSAVSTGSRSGRMEMNSSDTAATLVTSSRLLTPESAISSVESTTIFSSETTLTSDVGNTLADQRSHASGNPATSGSRGSSQHQQPKVIRDDGMLHAGGFVAPLTGLQVTRNADEVSDYDGDDSKLGGDTCGQSRGGDGHGAGGTASATAASADLNPRSRRKVWLLDEDGESAASFTMRAHPEVMRRVPRAKVPRLPGCSMRDWTVRMSNKKLQNSRKGIPDGTKPLLLPRYTPLEISQHNNPDDLWMVIRGVVYDCTQFQRYHPGGERLLLECAGRDATAVYDAFHPWISCEGMLAPYAIGLVAEE